MEGETILKADGKDGSHKIMYYPDGMVTVYKNEPTGDSQFSEYNLSLIHILCKSGQWDALQMVPHKKTTILTNLRTSNLRFGITVAVNQDTEKKNHCNNTGQSQNAVHVKLTLSLIHI